MIHIPMPNDFESEESSSNNNKLNKQQKWSIAGLAVFALLIVILWIAQLKNNIYAPLNSAPENKTAVDSQTAGDLALKDKDTDADGLSDYDELNVYKTSPYLEDSDSDGFKDGEEINKGEDPNCPKGRACLAAGNLGSATSTLPANGSSEVLNNLLNQYGAVESELKNNENQTTNQNLSAEQAQTLKNIDAATLRQMLIEAGMPKETLDKVSDEELMKSYGETLEGQ